MGRKILTEQKTMEVTIGKAIVEAAQCEHDFLDTLLTQCNADVNINFSIEGQRTTPLLWLITMGKHEAIRRLIFKANIDTIGPDVHVGKSPRMVGLEYLQGEYPTYLDIDNILGMTSVLQLIDSRPLTANEVNMIDDITEKYKSTKWLCENILINGFTLSQHITDISNKVSHMVADESHYIFDHTANQSQHILEYRSIADGCYTYSHLEAMVRKNNLEAIQDMLARGKKPSADVIMIAACRESSDTWDLLTKFNPDLDQVFSRSLPDRTQPWGQVFSTTPLLLSLFIGEHRAARRLLSAGASVEPCARNIHDGKDACTIALEFLDGHWDYQQVQIDNINGMIDLVFGTILKEGQTVTLNQGLLLRRLAVRYAGANIDEWFLDKVFHKHYSISKVLDEIGHGIETLERALRQDPKINM